MAALSIKTGNYCQFWRTCLSWWLCLWLHSLSADDMITSRPYDGWWCSGFSSSGSHFGWL